VWELSIGIGYDASLRFDYACGGHLPPSYDVRVLRLVWVYVFLSGEYS
jgi:hypothetical protein